MSGRFFDMEENMAEQTPQPEEIMAAEGSAFDNKLTESTVKNTTDDREEKRKMAQEAGNNNPTGVNQYTPSDKWYGASYHDTKVALKAYLDFNPDDHIEFIENLVRDAKKKDADPAVRKLFVQLSGGFDPSETKVSGEVMQIAENPLNQLSIEELRTLKALKKESSDGK